MSSFKIGDRVLLNKNFPHQYVNAVKSGFDRDHLIEGVIICKDIDRNGTILFGIDWIGFTHGHYLPGYRGNEDPRLDSPSGYYVHEDHIKHTTLDYNEDQDPEDDLL